MATFDLSSFNKAQKKAVTHAAGPLLIIAGAGTGKTHVITGRILHLILNKNTPAAQIVALTFTEKASTEMTERVDRALPLGSPVPLIKTFHGFCDWILRQHGAFIGFEPTYTIYSEVDQWIFLKKRLFNFDLKHYRPLNNPSKYIGDLLTHISRLKDEAISPADYKRIAQTPQELELAVFYEQYQHEMRKAHALDYGDLIYYTLHLFETQPHALNIYQNLFQHILVDEFQDVNFAQNKLLYFLANTAKTTVVVGDDDQSIYKWRGASVLNILEFTKHFSKAKRVVLTENYRSNQPILDMTYALIAHNNPHRLEATEGLKKKLIAHNSDKQKPEIHSFLHDKDEKIWIIETIKKLRSEGIVDCAIITRTNYGSMQFIDLLKKAHIPYQYLGREGLLHRREIKDVLACLRYISNPTDTMALFRCLQSSLFAISLDQVLEYIKTNRIPLDTLFHDTDALQKTLDIMNELSVYAKNHTIADVLNQLFTRTNYFEKLETKDAETSNEKRVSIEKFGQLILDFEKTPPPRRGQKTVSDFVEYLNLLEQAGEHSIPLQKELDPEAVKLITVHSAKGLEFDAVCVPFVANHKFPAIQRLDTIPIPEKIIPEKITSKDFHMQEERRLFYVACTRAKRRLFITHSMHYSSGGGSGGGTLVPRQWKPSPFVLEAIQSGKPHVKQHHHEPLLLQKTDNRTHRAIQSKYTLQLNKLSYTQIDTFTTCPLRYQFRYLFGIQTPPSASLNFGAAIHNTLKAFYEKIQHDKHAPAFEYLQMLYEQHWIAKGFEHSEHERLRKTFGLEMLKRFYEAQSSNAGQWTVPHAVEQSFVLRLSKATVVGRIDRIDPLPDGTYEIIDYKTGVLKSQRDVDNNLQLSLYALACRDALKLPVSKLSLYFIEENKKISTSRDDDALAVFSEELNKYIDTLTASDFTAAPGYHCNFCDYRSICDYAAIMVR